MTWPAAPFLRLVGWRDLKVAGGGVARRLIQLGRVWFNIEGARSVDRAPSVFPSSIRTPR
ncbi:hypothetical protein GCM10009540_86330 [Streptomyces turgidiscabies]